MPPVDTNASGAVTDEMSSRSTVVAGWGGIGSATVSVVRPRDVATASAAVPVLSSAHGGLGRGVIARGAGRSYGDAAQRNGGVVLDTSALTAIELDAGRGVVRAEAGVRLGALLRTVAPAGWVLPVVPGTQHVTVGGAIAADIHGKNHASAGTFADHICTVGLLKATGELCELTRGRDDELLATTVGGMGLTGLIVWATIALRPLRSPLLSVDTERVGSLNDALAVLAGPGGEYRVAWLDLLGPGTARGIVTRASHLDEVPARRRSGGVVQDARLTVRAGRTARLLRPAIVRAFNAYRLHRAPRRRTGEVQAFGAHMFPLDAIDAWPRLYGPSGIVQYQFAVPSARDDVLGRVIAELRRSSVPCYLAVLKDLGAEGEAFLSFPVKGWTLALDMPGDAPGLSALLDRFDAWVAEAGGRVYLAKDGRLRPEMLAAMYPRVTRWRAVRDRHDPGGVWVSDLGVRTGLVAGPR